MWDGVLDRTLSEITNCIVVPPNTSVTVYLPQDGHVALNGPTVSGRVHELVAGTYEFEVA